MTWRGLVVALLCGVLGLGGGAVAAWATQQHATAHGTASPVPAVSPSVPIDPPSVETYQPDNNDFATLSRDLALPTKHKIRNDLATWQYHVPQGWQAYVVCGTPGNVCAKGESVDKPLTPKQIGKASEIRFRPAGENVTGGYSLRVKILDNTLNDLGQMRATKLQGFRTGVPGFHVDRRTPSAVYLDYKDPVYFTHRFNYFQWFACPGQPNATLEMSVVGRQRDVPGLKALMNRFADDVQCVKSAPAP